MIDSNGSPRIQAGLVMGLLLIAFVALITFAVVAGLRRSPGTHVPEAGQDPGDMDRQQARDNGSHEAVILLPDTTTP